MEQAAVLRQELNTSWDSATGANKAAYFDELASVDTHNTANPLAAQRGKDLGAWAGLSTGEKRERPERLPAGTTVAPPGWTPEEFARGERMIEVDRTNADVARSKARGARRPNISELE
jgi:hypothetical protein